MAKQLIECPICEAQFTVSVPTGTGIKSPEGAAKCPECRQSFELQQALGIHSQDVEISDSKTKLAPDALLQFDPRDFPSLANAPLKESLPPPLPKTSHPPALDSSRQDQDPAFAQPPPSLPSPNDEGRFHVDGQPQSPPVSPGKSLTEEPPIEIGANSSTNSVYLKILQRHRRQSFQFWLTIAGLLIVTCILAVPLYRVASKEFFGESNQEHDQNLKLSEDPKTETTATLFPAEVDPIAATSSLASEQAPEQAPEQSQQQTARDQPPPALPPFLLFDRRQVNQIWNDSRPFLLALEIEGPRGKQRAVGTIIDSRGWCVTSYQAVHDAWKIDVVAATHSLQQSSQEPPLRDTVRGIVLAKPELDLAILAVNRRFVVSLADLPIPTEDRMVAATRLMAVAPPNPENYHGFSEVKIEQRGKLAEFPSEIQARLSTLPGDITDIQWLSLSGGIDLLPGTPLLDQQGQLRSIVSVQRQQAALAVPVTQLSKLKTEAPGRLIPLKTPVVHTDGGVQSAAINHPALLLSQQIRSDAELCSGFGWIATDPSELQQLIQFLENLQLGKDYLKKNKPDYRDPSEIEAARTMLRDTIDECQLSLQTQLQTAKDQTDGKLAAMNRLAHKQLFGPGERTAPILVEVFAGFSQLDFMVFQFDYVQDYVNIPFDQSAPVMRPGSRWLILVRSPADKPVKNFRTSADRRMNTRSLERITEIGPFQ